jgi:hypothetical protein
MKVQCKARYGGVRQSKRTSAETFLLKTAVLAWKKESMASGMVVPGTSVMAQGGVRGWAGREISPVAIKASIGT